MTIQSINPDHHIEMLRRIAKYHSVHMIMIVLAIFTIVGGFGILIVSYLILPQAKNMFLTIMVCSLIILSILIMYYKKNHLIILTSAILGFILIRCWNITYNTQPKHSFSIIYFINVITLTFILLLFFLKNIYDYRKYCQFTPDPNLYEWLKKEIQFLNTHQSFLNENVIQFSTKYKFSKKNQIAWRGCFYNQCIILVWGTTAKIVKRGNLTIHEKRRGFFGIDFVIEGKKYSGRSDETSYKRYIQWEQTAIESSDDWYVPWA